MNSIRSKIQRALVGSIVFVGLCAVLVLIVNQFNALKDQKIIRTMTTEYSIISLTDNLALAYNDAIKSSGDTVTSEKYYSIKNSLLNVITNLKLQIADEESMSTLMGVENTVKKVLDECDSGLKEVQNNNLENITRHLVEANKNSDFVRDNVRTLLQKELEYLTRSQESSRQIYMIIIIVSAGFFVMVILLMIYYAHRVSRQVIGPIEQLTEAAKEVISGNVQVQISKDLMKQNDEVGSLSKSFIFMVDTVQTKIAELKTSKDALEEGNAELAKLNGFMVDRELKMVELKKQLSELKAVK